jgi:hypothetical protein
MNFSFLTAGRFWFAGALALLVTGLLFAWILNAFAGMGFPGPPRFAPSTQEVVLSFLIVLLVGINTGLIAWYRGLGVCPLGTKGATGAAGGLGAIALLCPACLLLPTSFAGIGLSLGLLAPFTPVFQIIAVMLLLVSFYLLLPKTVPVQEDV